MIKKRLLALVPESKRYIAANVLFQWLGMCSNIAIVYTIATMLGSLIAATPISYGKSAVIIIAAALVRVICVKLANTASYKASRSVKRTIRGMLYEKLLKLGSSYTEHVPTAEVVQLAGEGVEQLETYFGQYMPQFFYAFLAPITLFFVVRPISVRVAVVLLVCVPLIPVAIMLVQKIAKRLLKNYWGQYAKLGDHFLENLQGLTTLKIYQADEARHKEMNEDAERFRKITMKVLTMQLNSIIVMDLVAYGGAALGIMLAILGYVSGDIDFVGSFMIILLSADFFIPMRQLGSFFHVAMNGMTASDKIFAILDLPEDEAKTAVPETNDILIRDVHFGYTEDKEILGGVNMEFKEGSFTAIVGESGCGKSTIAGILTNRNKNYQGSIRIGKAELRDIAESELMKRITLISHNSYIFKGSLRENLMLGKMDAGEEELWDVLRKVNLYDFVKTESGLDLELLEAGTNLSGGQRQRLALARALLHDSPVYIFDEATSNIDVESENDIMGLILSMTRDKTFGNKTVILISHRLANVVNADNIYVIKSGKISQSGSHGELLQADGEYARLWNEQQALENMLKEEA